MNPPLAITVLGATGSVGRQALEVAAAFPERFRVVGLAARGSTAAMADLVTRHKPDVVVMSDAGAAAALKRMLPDTRARIETGEESLERLAADPQSSVVVAAIVGRAGLNPSLAAVRSGKKVALANKETLVMAGDLLMAEARRCGATVLPVDSEHAAIHQLLQGVPREQVRRVVLTASGGPFLGRPDRDLESVTAQEALDHPRWEMGAKVSIDSATMMNKGFEIIEARWLFDLPGERIGVVVHPQSIVHGLVELNDGSVLAQLGEPDMRLPIAHALAFPDRLDLPGRIGDVRPLRFSAAGDLFFREAGDQEFPALALCRRALAKGPGVCAALSVADEVLVQAFLSGRIRFTRILPLLQEVLAQAEESPVRTLAAALTAGAQGERLANALLDRQEAP